MFPDPVDSDVPRCRIDAATYSRKILSLRPSPVTGTNLSSNEIQLDDFFCYDEIFGLSSSSLFFLFNKVDVF